ncbi:MAG: hypothetical protein J6U05_04735 [Neisseriaceae bacterium]|nr:hypothetical protein [Neisseriaceae bacterium]
MPTVMTHSPQELTVLCSQLSAHEQEQVFNYIQKIINKHSIRSHKDYAQYFGVLKDSQDPLAIQKAMRDEWR